MKLYIENIEYNLVLTHISNGKVIASAQNTDLSSASLLGEFISPTFHCNHCNSSTRGLTVEMLSELLPKSVKGNFYPSDEGDEYNEYGELGDYEYLPVLIIEQ